MKRERIVIVDALRGIALLLIVLIHYVEHFDFFKQPEINFLFSNNFDSQVMHATFLLISGKAYSIFALLFGLSFYIQMNNKESKGINYSTKFFWRMLILLVIGFIHSLFYRGDILHIYALLSLPVIPLYKVKTKYLWLIIVLLIIQIPFLYHLVQTFITPNYEYVEPLTGHFAIGNDIYATGSLYDVMSYNFWKGRITAWAWTFNNGRYLQLIALFIVGIILGRKRVFEQIDACKKGIKTTLITSLILYAILFFVKKELLTMDFSAMQKQFMGTLLTSFINLCITSTIICLTILVYNKFKHAFIFKLFSAYGKMSLTNYVAQALFGVIFFYGFGLAMYRYLGSTWSLILGGVIFFVQAYISKYWNKNYYYGPLEWLWRCATDLDFNVKFKRKTV
ncbi:DUF418 domain-containing protein [Flavivirga eckloniae]|uniref:DUF418 domain-containing protein n=1 Tax=Flavivirga eckloniae TaxID=1803846 RepID=A0A2K9PP65_9FLAO|nr:DUF418 domain-containing protein [Flavivirga eckloniae]AUP78608.1 hypothetical protein C1H87_07735 [Flavivirga eckloniae]